MTSIVFEDYGVRIGETNTDVDGDSSIDKDDVGLGGIFDLFTFFLKVRNGASRFICDVFEKVTNINVPDWIFDSSQTAQTLTMVAYSTSAYLSSHDVYLGYAVTDDGCGNTTISLSPCQGRKNDNSMYGAHYDGSSNYELSENNMSCKVVTITRSEPWIWKKWTKAALSKTFFGDGSWEHKSNLPDKINNCYNKKKYKYSISVSNTRLKKLEKKLFKQDYPLYYSFSFTASSSKAFNPKNLYRGSLAVLKQAADDAGGFSTTNDTNDGAEWPGVFACHSYVDYCLKWAIGTRAFDTYGDTITFSMCPGHPQVCVYLQIFTFGTDTGMGENEDNSDPKHPKSGTYNLFDKVDSNPFCKNFEVFMSKNGEFKNNWNSYKYVPGSGGTTSKYEYEKTTITNNDYKACFN